MIFLLFFPVLLRYAKKIMPAKAGMFIKKYGYD